MNKSGKIIGAIILVIIVGIAGLIAFVHFYLTEERVKEFIIPQAEATLGRKVAIGDIKIGLFSGITIKDFLIKEADRESNFVSTKAFVLNYDLMPLLRKKIVINEIRFDEPTVQILRDKNGKFNYSTLTVLEEKKNQKAEKKSDATTKALPLALTFNQIRLDRARIKIRDQLKEIPAVDATVNARLNVSLGHTLQDIQYNGSYDFNATVEHGEAKVMLNGKGNIDRNNLDIALDTSFDGEKVHSDAAVKNYSQSPDATLNISGETLNIDKLLAMIAGLPASPASGKSEPDQPETVKSSTVIADSLPPGLTAEGTVKVNKAVYKKITTNDLNLVFKLNKGILTVQELSARAYDGKVGSDLTVDLNRPGLVYNGNFGLESVRAGDLSSAIVQKTANMLTGSLQTSTSFAGAGTTWEELRDVLTADGSFSLTDGSIKGTPISSSIASLLGLQELNNITYKNISGTFKIVEGGKVKLKTSMQGNDVGAETEGIIGLDGSLDLPLTLHLSPALADKLRARASFAKYLTDEQGGASLNLKLAGSLKHPRPTLDMRGVKKQVEQTIKNEIFKKLDSSSKDSKETDQKDSPESIIKGLFGR